MIRSLLPLVLLAFPVAAQPATDTEARPQDPLARLRALPPLQMDEVTWLARCLTTESDRPREQWYVAWVVRNRVETQFAGITYREVVLEPYQFSAFNTSSPARDAALALTPFSEAPHWREAVRIALAVVNDDGTGRPFPASVRHFYSPVSMPGGMVPEWARGRQPVALNDPAVSDHRFRFYDGLDAGAEAPSRMHPVVLEAPAVAPAEPSSRRTRVREKLRTRVTIDRPARPTRPKRTGS